MSSSPPGHDQDAVIKAAAERGVAVEGVAALRVASGGPPALMLGFARLPEHRIAQAVRLLAVAIIMTRPGGPPHPTARSDPVARRA
jgi:GntR family transcriptional regulator / MocR family aminotransferase